MNTFAVQWRLSCTDLIHWHPADLCNAKIKFHCRAKAILRLFLIHCSHFIPTGYFNDLISRFSQDMFKSILKEIINNLCPIGCLHKTFKLVWQGLYVILETITYRPSLNLKSNCFTQEVPDFIKKFTLSVCALQHNILGAYSTVISSKLFVMSQTDACCPCTELRLKMNRQTFHLQQMNFEWTRTDHSKWNIILTVIGKWFNSPTYYNN